MSKSIPALVNPKLLKFGREVINLDAAKVADKLSITEQRLKNWETGVSNPTLAQLRKIANIYKRSEAFFYLPDIPQKVKKRVADFRNLPTHRSKQTYSSEFLILLEETYRRQAIAIDLAEELEEELNIDLPIISSIQDPEESANLIRKALKITASAQQSWNESYEALGEWINAVENLGILVFKSSRANVPVEEMRGFAIWDDLLPAIVLNASDNDNPKIFTLMHELAHLALRHSDMFGSSSQEDVTDSDIEVFCNHVAGAILVPKDSILQDPIIRFLKDDILLDEEIETLSNKFHVSQEVILRRLLLVDKISNSFYREKRKHFLSIPIDKKTVYGSSDYAKQIIGKQGKLYPRIIFRSLYEDHISVGEASKYLNSKIKHFNRLEELIFD